MRKLSYVGLVVLFLAIGARRASADSITTGNLSFTCDGGCGGSGIFGHTAPTAGSFTYDNTTNQFTNFSITWNDIVWSVSGLTETNYLALNGIGPNQQRWFAFSNASVMLPLSFCDNGCGFQVFLVNGTTVTDDLNGTLVSFTAPVPTFPYDAASGDIAATDLVTTTPEPAVAGLLLVGLGFALIAKKHFI